MCGFSEKIFAVTLSVIMLFSACFSVLAADGPSANDEGSTLPSHNEILLGDVDENGRVTASDARLTLRAAAGLLTLVPDERTAADYNKDGKVNAYDARLILRVSANLDPYAPDVPATTKPKELTDADRRFSLSLSDKFSTSYARYACLYDYDNDKVLYGKNMYEPCHPASTTKVITAVLGCEYLSADYILTVGQELYLVNYNTSRAGLYVGQRIKFSEILKCLLAPSGCDAAYVIASHVAKVASNNPNLSAAQSIDYFIRLMNSYTKGLGMKHSNFQNPDGFPHYNHYTCAYDMMIITSKAYGFELIRNVVCEKKVTAHFENGGTYTYYNTNETINPSSDRYYPYMVGVKTGSHSLAGQCLVTVARKKIEGTDKYKTFVAVVFKCPHKYGRYYDLRSLYNTAFNNFNTLP